MMMITQSNTMTTPETKRSISNRCLPPKKKMRRDADFQTSGNPTGFLINAFRENGFSVDEVKNHAQDNLLKITPDMIQAYTMEASKAVRDNDLETLRELHQGGANLDCCNKFGDSLIHIACRRGHTRIVKFLVEEAQVCVHRADDLKRTPLHDACWTHEPNFEIVDILLRAAPEQGLCNDNRGATPFEYARQQHQSEWMNFLSERRSLMVLSSSK